MHPCKKKRNTHTFSSLIVNLSNIVDWVHEEEQGSLSLNALTLHFISPYTILFAMFPPTCVLIIISVVLYVQSAYIYIYLIYIPFFSCRTSKIVHSVYRAAKSTILFSNISNSIFLFVLLLYLCAVSILSFHSTVLNMDCIGSMVTGSSLSWCMALYFVWFLAQWGCGSAEQQGIVMWPVSCGHKERKRYVTSTPTPPPQDHRLWDDDEGSDYLSAFLHLSGGFDNN